MKYGPLPMLQTTCMLLTMLSVWAEESATVPSTPVKAVDIVAFTEVGDAGQRPDKVIRVEAALSQSAPDSIILDITKEGKPSDLLIRLWGYKQSKSASYAALYAQLVHDARPINYGGGGCIFIEMPTSDVARRIDEGKIGGR